MIQASEGWFAGPNPRVNQLAGPDALVAGDPDGIAVARFGWANIDTGKALNARNSAADRLGWVFPVWGTWQRVYVHLGRRYVRPGLPVTLFTRGDFWAMFPGGALVGQPVYADPLDGTPISGYDASAELTPWVVLTDCAPGRLAIISTWSNFQ